MSAFLKGTLWLAATSLLVKLLGFLHRIIIARIAGEEGIGLYMAVFPTFILAVTIVQFGLPVAVTRSIAAASSPAERRHVLIYALSVTIGLSLIIAPAFLFFAPFLAEKLFHDSRAAWLLIAASPALPAIAVSSILRGYLHGRMRMKEAAFSQLIEQVVRIALIAGLGTLFIPYGIGAAAAAAMGAATAGELAALLYCLIVFRVEWRRLQTPSERKPARVIQKELADTALPALGSRSIGSVAWFLEPIFTVKSLARAGFTAEEALKLYGVLTGYVLPLLLLPSFFTSALSSSLVPDISESYSRHQYSRISFRVAESIRFCLVTGGFAVVLLLLFADTLLLVMYHTSQGSSMVKLLAPFFLFYYCQGPLQAVLQALNLSRAAMWNTLIGAVVKLLALVLLSSIPSIGIYGTAIALTASTVLVTLLHSTAVRKTVPIPGQWPLYAKTGILIAFSFVSTALLLESLQGSTLFLLSCGTLCSGTLYITAGFGIGLIKKEDAAYLRGFWKR